MILTASIGDVIKQSNPISIVPPAINVKFAALVICWNACWPNWISCPAYISIPPSVADINASLPIVTIFVALIIIDPLFPDCWNVCWFNVTFSPVNVWNIC